MTGPIRILHCAETIKGGIATYLRELIPLQCDEFGASHVVVLIPASQAGELPVPPGVRVVLFNDQGGRVGNALVLARETLALARAFKPSVVHVHSTFAGATVRPALAIGYRHARVVYCPHGWSWDRPMSPLARRLAGLTERLLSHLSDQIVCISAHEVRTAQQHGLPSNKLALVRNAVNTVPPEAQALARPVAWPEGTRRLLFVGRLDLQKGVDVLWRALEKLGPDTHALVAGAAVLADDAAAQWPRNATSVGWVGPGELETLFAQAELLVVPSRWEGFGLVAAEAMRSGLPVVASRVGGLTEVVEHGITGLLVEPNSPEALTQAIGNLSADDLARMGRAGRDRVQTLFSMPRLHRELCGVYRGQPDAI